MLWWLVFKIIGIVLIAFGAFLVIFFPGIPEHQEAGLNVHYTDFSLGAVVFGLILIIVGGFILFSP